MKIILLTIFWVVWNVMNKKAFGGFDDIDGFDNIDDFDLVKNKWFQTPSTELH